MKKSCAVFILLLAMSALLFSQDIVTQLSQRTLMDLQSGPGSDTGVLLDAYAKVYPALKGKETVASKVTSLASLKKTADPQTVMAEIAGICELMNKGNYNMVIDSMLTTALAYTWELMALKRKEAEFAKAAPYVEKAKGIQSLIEKAKTSDQMNTALSQYADLGIQAKKDGYLSISADIFNGIVQVKEQIKTVSGEDYLQSAQAFIEEGYFYEQALYYISMAKKYTQTEEKAAALVSSFDPTKKSLASRMVYGKSYYYWLWAQASPAASKEDRSSAYMYYLNGSNRALTLEYQSSFESSYARGLYEWTEINNENDYYTNLNSAAWAIQNAVMRDPNNPDILIDCGIICFKIGFYQLVFDAMDKLIAIGADSAVIRYYRGVSLYMYSLKNNIHFRTDDALKDLNVVLSSSPQIGSREIIDDAVKYYKGN